MMAMESLIPTSIRPCKSPLKFLNRTKIHGSRRSSIIITAASQDPNSGQQQLDLSVLRFTFGNSLHLLHNYRKRWVFRVFFKVFWLFCRDPRSRRVVPSKIHWRSVRFPHYRQPFSVSVFSEPSSAGTVILQLLVWYV